MSRHPQPPADEPGARLMVHRAPDGLLERALRAPAAAAPEPLRPSRLRPLAYAAVFLFGVSAGYMSALLQGDGQPQPQVVVEADRADLVPVRLVLHAPGARTVEVAGTWNDWEPRSTPLHPLDDQTFAAVVYLPRGQHEYMFVVDGEQWLTDPAALLTKDDGFGRKNALLEI